MATKCNLDEQWINLSTSIDQFLTEHEDKNEEGRFKITKSHWIQNKERKRCSNTECRLSFSLTERKHHCRRCGEIFCSKCSMYTQRLSLLAQRDPDGGLYKVCILCFNKEDQSFGQKRNHMDTFKKFRSICQQQQNITNEEETDSVDADITSDISNRLESLTSSFHDHLNNNNRTSEVVSLVKSPIAVPSWQLPKCGFKSSKVCFCCTKKFSVFRTVHHCRVCGAAVCKNCSNEELLMYMEDNSTERKAHWAVINVTGCPNIPPEIRECIRICIECHSHAVHIKLQIIVNQQMEDKVDVTKNIEKSYAQLSDLKIKIDNVLCKYRELVNAIEVEKNLNDIVPKGESTTKILAKYNSDTSDLFIQFGIDMQRFKKVRPRTSTQMELMRSIITAMHAYYSKNFFTFRQLQRTLDSILGPRALESVQIIVDYQAINCTFLALKQLGLECLDLCNKYQVHFSLLSLLATCDETCKNELQKEVRASGEDWEQHEKNIQGFLRVRLKEKRLLFYSKKNRESKDLEDWLLRKCDLVLLKVQRQLSAKSSVNKFRSTKETLEKVRLKIDSDDI